MQGDPHQTPHLRAHFHSTLDDTSPQTLYLGSHMQNFHSDHPQTLYLGLKVFSIHGDPLPDHVHRLQGQPLPQALHFGSPVHFLKGDAPEPAPAVTFPQCIEWLSPP